MGRHDITATRKVISNSVVDQPGTIARVVQDGSPIPTKDNPGMNSMRYQLPTMVTISKMTLVGSNTNKTQFMLCSVRTYILTLRLTFNSMKLMAKESSVYSQI